MCYAYGSIDQATKVCPMCKVFRPSSARCPHINDVCRNRSLHPRHDVVFLKNAEVQSFNGCGYCKWARTNPPSKLAGYQNPGWPGCCRPPTTSEQRWIQAADWPSVSVVHQVPIPADIKTLLESLTIRVSGPPSSGRGTVGQQPMPSSDRKNSGNSSPSHKSNLLLGKTPSMTIPTKVRSGGSPQLLTASLTVSNSRGVGGGASSVPTSSSMEQFQSMRRQTHSESTEKRFEAPHSSHSSPARKNIDLETVTRRNSGGRPSVTTVTHLLSATNISTEAQPHDTELRRRSSVSSGTPVSLKPVPGTRPGDRGTGSVTFRVQPKRPSIDMSSASSSSGSSEGLGSATDSTVTSDGGFTDYLSDESEAELQRQAEARAALVAQNQAEEQEFKAARQQLAHVDLRPPKSWNAASLPRSSGSSAHVPSYSTSITYSNAPYTSGMAHTGPSSRG